MRFDSRRGRSAFDVVPRFDNALHAFNFVYRSWLWRCISPCSIFDPSSLLSRGPGASGNSVVCIACKVLLVLFHRSAKSVLERYPMYVLLLFPDCSISLFSVCRCRANRFGRPLYM